MNLIKHFSYLSACYLQNIQMSKTQYVQLKHCLKHIDAKLNKNIHE